MTRRPWYRYPVSAARWAIALALLYQATTARVESPETSWAPEKVTLPRGVPFEVRTEDDRAWAVHYIGGLALRQDGLHAALMLGRGGPARGVQGLISVDAWGLGIAESSPAGFRIVSEHMIPDPRPTLHIAGEWYMEAPSAYLLEGVGPEDLVDRWPVFIHEVRLAPPPANRPMMPKSPSYIREYVHLPRDTFDRLLGPRRWEG